MSTGGHESHGVLKIAHHHPGRLRVRANAFANDGESVGHVKDELARIRGIRSVEHDPRSGSVLVQYEPRLVKANRIIERIATVGDLDVSPPEPRNARDSANGVLELFRWLDTMTEQATGSRLSLRLLVPGGVAAASVYSFFKSSHPRLPRWDNLAYWAFSLFVELNARREVTRP